MLGRPPSEEMLEREGTDARGPPALEDPVGDSRMPASLPFLLLDDMSWLNARMSGGT